MQTQRINITIPNSVLRYLQESIPAGKRSRFITEAVLGKLGDTENIEQQLKKSLKNNNSFYNQVGRDWKAIEFETWPK